MSGLFTDKELDELDDRFARALEDRSDAYSETINALNKRIEELEGEIERLRAIIAQWYADWPEPWAEGMDGFEMQEFGEKHGILIAETRTTPCHESCSCGEAFGDNETVDCYRLAPEYLNLST